jgi:hypothetical protein
VRGECTPVLVGCTRIHVWKRRKKEEEKRAK